jgi:hypothetical protein
MWSDTMLIIHRLSKGKDMHEIPIATIKNKNVQRVIAKKSTQKLRWSSK